LASVPINVPNEGLALREVLTYAKAKTLGVVDGTPVKANTLVGEPWLSCGHVYVYELLDVNELFELNDVDEVNEVASSVQQLADFGAEDR
jgi:hypothetical protein